jgi:hypothetical protein
MQPRQRIAVRVAFFGWEGWGWDGLGSDRAGAGGEGRGNSIFSILLFLKFYTIENVKSTRT